MKLHDLLTRMCSGYMSFKSHNAKKGIFTAGNCIKYIHVCFGKVSSQIGKVSTNPNIQITNALLAEYLGLETFVFDRLDGHNKKVLYTLSVLNNNCAAARSRR